MFGYRKLKRRIASLESFLGVTFAQGEESYDDEHLRRDYGRFKSLEDLQEKFNNQQKETTKK